MVRLRKKMAISEQSSDRDTLPTSTATQADISGEVVGSGQDAQRGFPGVEQAASCRPPDAKHAKAVRLLWCDNGGIRRCRVVPGRRLAALHSCGLGVTAACMAMPAYGDSPAPGAGLSVVGEARMKPVEATRVEVPWCPGHQMAVVEFEAPKSDTLWDCCPRRALASTCKMLQDNFGLSLQVGFELEFLLLERAPAGQEGLMGSGWQPVDSALYCQSSALDRQAEVLQGMVDALEAMGIGVVQWHAESAPGQYEISLTHGDPMESADKLLMAKEAVVGVAARHGRAVSFLPKPSPDSAGSGCHVHFSLWRDGKCAMHDATPRSFGAPELEAAAAAIVAAAADPPPQPATAASADEASSAGCTTTEGRQSAGGDAAAAAAAAGTPIPFPRPSLEMLSFLAGVLSYMDVLLPFTAPSPNSYARLQPGTWAGAHAAWGYNNREVPLRVTAPGPCSLDAMHVELKALDGTANPHLALAAIAVAGMLGLYAQLFPPEPCQVAPAELDPETAARLGVRPLPDSLSAALEALQHTPAGEEFRSAMEEAISQPLLTAYLAVREAEACQAPEDDPAHMLLRYS